MNKSNEVIHELLKLGWAKPNVSNLMLNYEIVCMSRNQASNIEACKKLSVLILLCYNIS